MIQIAHVTAFNLTTLLEEVLYFTSSASLALNNQNYLPRIGTKLSYTENLFSQGATEGQGTVGVGNLVLTNNDGGLDALVSKYAFDGRKIQIYIADENNPQTNNSTLYFTGVIDHPEYNFDTVTLFVKNRMEAINVPYQAAVFAGTNVGAGGSGGFEGQNTTIGGKIKPAIFGRCMSVEGMPVNDFYLVYAFNYDRLGVPKPIYKFYNVYVKGIQYLYCGDYATPALLILAVIPTGYYATCVASGYIRLGSVPANNGAVVADLADAPEPQCSAGQVAGRILTASGYVAGTDYNGASLAVLDAKNACPTGIQISDNSTIAANLNNILASIGAWIIPDSLGVFQSDIVDTVANMQAGPNGLSYAPVATIVADLIDPARTVKIQADNQSRNIPAYSVKVNHTKNWKTQSSGALADAVTNTLRTFFGADYRAATVTNTAIQTAHLLSPTLEYSTFLNQPLQAAIQNGDFTLDLAGLNSGWTFGNLNGGNGALTQANSGCVLIPTSGGQCYIQQTLNSTQDIQPGTWQLMVTIPGKYAGQVIIAQGAVGLYNQSYVAQVNDQDLIIPFTMLGSGTQSITITLQTVDATTSAAFASVVVCQPVLPTQPVNGALINANFNSALGTGWTFSNNTGGTGVGIVSGGSCTLTPSGTGTCQITQAIVPTGIWPGNWLFGITVNASSSAVITIAQGVTVIYQSTVVGSRTSYFPFPFTSTGTQQLNITIATVDAATNCSVKTAILCLNNINLTSRAVIANSFFTIPFNQVGNGWLFNSTGSGSYSQSNGSVTFNTASGVSSISQTLTLPDKIQQGNWQLSLVNSSVSGSITVNAYQGTVQVGTLAIAASTTGTLPFTLSSYGAVNVTVVIQSASSSCTFANLNIQTIQQSLSPTYAGLLNGDFTLSLGIGWTFANTAGGSGTAQLYNDYCILRPTGTSCNISQTILAASIPAGNWQISLVLAAGFSGVVTVAGTTQLISRTYSSLATAQYITLPFVTTGTNITVTLGTKGTNQAKFKNVNIVSYDMTNLTTFANITNGNFANLILNLTAGWIFSNDISGTGIYKVANGALTLTPAAAGCQVSQILNMPNGIYPGAWNLSFTLSAGTQGTVSVYQGAALIATQSCIAASTVATGFTVPVVISAINSSSITIMFHTNSLSVLGLTNVVMSAQTAGLTPLQEANRRLAIESSLQERYTLDLPISIGMGIKAGNMVTVQLNRFNMYGKTYLVIGRNDDHDTESVLLDIFRA